MSGVLIIGAGHAGGSAAAFLRQYGYDGPITLIGAEPSLPYQRPPLSKAWLKGEAGEDDLQLRPQAFYDSHNIDIRLSTTVEAINSETQDIILPDGRLSYDHLIIATGSKARPFNVPGSDRVPHYLLRTLAHAEDFKSLLHSGRHVGLIGAGYVGLEVAASARKLGCEVTLFEREPRILARVASSYLSNAFTRIHRDAGIEIKTEARVAGLASVGQKEVVVLEDGAEHLFDHLLVGIGALPADDLAQAAGIACDNGIVVDHEARTSVANVFAIGDVTSREIKPWYAGRYRLESVPNALEQAKQAAAAITGHKAPTPEVPWFWSDQYDYKLQIAGLTQTDAEQVVRGDPDSEAFSVFHLNRDRHLVCVESVNRPADFMAGKQLIARQVPLEADVLRDTEASLKPLLAR